MGKQERDKGARFERWVAKNLGTERVGTRGKKDAEHADIIHPRFYIQCKHYRRIAISHWFKETEKGAKKFGKTPLLAIKSDYTTPLIVLRFDDFLKLMGGKDGQVPG